MARSSDSPVTFLLRDPKAKKPTPINCIVRFDNQRINVGTGFKALPTHWNLKTSRVKNVVDALDKDDINSFLDKLESAIKEIVTELRASRSLTVKAVRQRIDAYLKPVVGLEESKQATLFTFIDKFIENSPQRINLETGKHINERTIKKYRTTVKALRNFASLYKRPVDFDTIDLDFYSDFTAYLTTKEGLAMNSVGKCIQILKVFLNEATAKGVNTKLEFKSNRFKVLKEDADSIYLTELELQRLNELDLSNNLRLERVRDLFLVGCYTGLRFSDFTAIRPEYIKEGLIRMEQLKTMGKVVIPCHPVVTALLQKYNGKLPQAISNQKMNDYIKEVCQLAGFTSHEGKSITKGGVRVFRSVEKWQLVSTHTARRSFATNMYLLGVPAITIMRITGHKTEKAFMRYIKLDEEQHAKIIALHWQKQLQNTPFPVAS
ncbi:site-specific integrase [Spirosoma migulaei]